MQVNKNMKTCCICGNAAMKLGKIFVCSYCERVVFPNDSTQDEEAEYTQLRSIINRFANDNRVILHDIVQKQLNGIELSPSEDVINQLLSDYHEIKLETDMYWNKNGELKGREHLFYRFFVVCREIMQSEFYKQQEAHHV